MPEKGKANATPKAVTRRMIVAAAAAIAGVGRAQAYRHYCFLKGTRISTLAGERRIEDLNIGDVVPTVFGGARPIVSTGRIRRTRPNSSKSWAKDARPVRIGRSALAPNVPSADLFVTQGHALLIDGLLIPAGTLVNDTTISLWPADEHEELEFYHVKLESHDVIYAEGAPCESLLQAVETMNDPSSSFRRWGADGKHCAPIACNGLRTELVTEIRNLLSASRSPRQLDLIRARLDARATALPEPTTNGRTLFEKVGQL